VTAAQQPDPAGVESLDPDLTERSAAAAPEKKRLDLSTVQIGASALASVTSALAASVFGVAGTLIGAAVGSIVSTVAGAIYADSLRRAGQRVRATQAIVVRPVDPDVTPTVRLYADQPQTRPISHPAPVEVTPEVSVPAAVRVPVVPWWRGRPGAVLAVCVLGFAISVGAITATEALRQQPVSGGTGTTVGRVLGQDPSATEQTPTPTPSTSPTDSAPPSATPATSAPAIAPTAVPTTAPTTGTPDVTSAPAAGSGSGGSGVADQGPGAERR
jgi:hypothetical protein